MAVAASTDALRKDIANWLQSSLANDAGTMSFGTGGVDSTGKVVAVDTSKLELTDERGQFSLHAWGRKNDTTILVTGRLPAGGLVGIPISQAGLKVGGRLYAVRNFAEKTFEIDEYFDINIEVQF